MTEIAPSAAVALETENTVMVCIPTNGVTKYHIRAGCSNIGDLSRNRLEAVSAKWLYGIPDNPGYKPWAPDPFRQYY